MVSKAPLIICAAALLGSEGSPAMSASSQEQQQRATQDRWMTGVDSLMREALVPGLQVAVIQDGRISVHAFGVADARDRRRVTDATVFEAASLSKPVLAYAVLRLASENRIDLDAPIGRYLPDLSADVQALTPRQLLSHSAGLPNSANGILAVQQSQKGRFSYSGEGFQLLQRVVERISGASLQDVASRSVFAPLNMASSSFVWRDDYAVRKASGHGPAGSWAGRSRLTQARAASTLETTAGDYARFLIAAVRGQGLHRDVALQFLQPQVALQQGCIACLEAPTAPPSPHHWGLALGLERHGERSFAWHWGDNGNMQSYAAIDSTASRGVVLLANSANGHSIFREIASRILQTDAPGYAWLAVYAQHDDPARRLLSRIVRDPSLDVAQASAALPVADVRRVAERLLADRRPGEASALLQALIARAPGVADDHVLLANALRRSGDFAGATRAAQAALSLAPGSPAATTALQRIQQAQTRLPDAMLARYTGRYASPFGPLQVQPQGGRLTAILLDQPPSDMLPLSDRTFLMEAMGVPIEFVTDARGTVTHALVQAGGQIRLDRER